MRTMPSLASVSIANITMAGFRGVRRRISLDLPQGFAVITGRNGSGKSTICDALEFALTGVISKYGEAVESKETVEDYLWWRGTALPEESFVSVTLLDATSRNVTVRRDRSGVSLHVEGVAETSWSVLERFLCDLDGAPPEPIQQLCRTSIIRDEWIASQSLDQAETDRFAFVKAALGSDILDRVEKQGKQVVSMLEARYREHEREYELARRTVTTLVEQLARARSKSSESANREAAEAALAALVTATKDAVDLRVAARREVASMRQRAERIDSIAVRLDETRRVIAAMSDSNATDEASLSVSAIAAQSTTVESLRQVLAEISAAGVDDAVSDAASSFAALFKHGSHLGLQDGHCPLCASELTEEEFLLALTRLQTSIAVAAREAADRQAQLEQAEDELNIATARLAVLSADREREVRARERVLTQAESLEREIEGLGVVIPGGFVEWLVAGNFEEYLRSHATDIRERAFAVELALQELDAAESFDALIDIERQLADAEAHSVAAALRVEASKAASDRAKSAIQRIRRGINEVIEERLFSLAPLLQELYQRLRPHVEWQEVTYQLRGEVRRFLSLRVGDNMNPRFMFSSGQRRAAGLAFLLAVHLSRPWSRFNSLVLDDPVQHIDDYRALHIVETLSAIRRGGSQVICTVEDDSVAQLLTRRLRGEHQEDGVVIEMDYEPGDGVVVSSRRVVRTSGELLLMA
jgi:chromosome segregation protein